MPAPDGFDITKNPYINRLGFAKERLINLAKGHHRAVLLTAPKGFDVDPLIDEVTLRYRNLKFIDFASVNMPFAEELWETREEDCVLILQNRLHSLETVAGIKLLLDATHPTHRRNISCRPTAVINQPEFHYRGRLIITEIEDVFDDRYKVAKNVKGIFDKLKSQLSHASCRFPFENDHLYHYICWTMCKSYAFREKHRLSKDEANETLQFFGEFWTHFPELTIGTLSALAEDRLTYRANDAYKIAWWERLPESEASLRSRPIGIWSVPLERKQSAPMKKLRKQLAVDYAAEQQGDHTQLENGEPQ